MDITNKPFSFYYCYIHNNLFSYFQTQNNNLLDYHSHRQIIVKLFDRLKCKHLKRRMYFKMPVHPLIYLFISWRSAYRNCTKCTQWQVRTCDKNATSCTKKQRTLQKALDLKALLTKLSHLESKATGHRLARDIWPAIF